MNHKINVVVRSRHCRKDTPAEENVRFSFTKELSTEEAEEFKVAFDMFDKKGTRKMYSKDLGNAMRVLGQNPTETELIELMNIIEVDGNGTIEFPEFCLMMVMIMKESDAELVRGAFRAFDRDGNGLISMREFTDFMMHTGLHFTKEEVDEMFEEIDIDGSGQIDYEEFINIITLPRKRPKESPLE